MLLIFGAKNGDAIPVGLQRASLIPHTGIEGNGQVLNNNQDFFRHGQIVLLIQIPPGTQH
jgi:hypothetical protein